MSDAFTRSLIGKTDPSPYDQVIFLSQEMINKAFHHMWALTPKKNPPPLRVFKQSYRTGDINITLDAPTIKLMVTTKQDPQLYFMLNINSGTIETYISSDPNDNTKKKFDVAGWKFGFAVKLASKIVEKSDPRFSSVVTQAGFSPDTYSLAQLYLEVSSSTQNSEKYNSYGKYDWKAESPETQAAFLGFCQSWWNIMKKSDCNIIGYSIQANKPDPTKVDSATFPPTSIDYWVYPWKDPNYSNPPDTDDSPKNALCYLMMSDFTKPPTRIGLEYSGAFVNGGGLYTMNAGTFWARWLLPLLQGLNKGAEIIPDEPLNEYYPNPSDGYHWAAGMRYHIGVSGTHSTKDPYYAFTKSTWRPGTWTWSGSQKTSSKTLSDGKHTTHVVSQTSTTSTELSFDKGGHGVTLKGKTVFDFNVQFNWDGSPWGNPSHLKITSEWRFKMALSSVSDGGIQFARVPETSGEKPCTVMVNADQGDVRWKYGFDSIKQSFSNSLNNYIDNDTYEIQNALLSSLDGQDKLFLPASGTFLMKDPKFNDRGDLLVTLSYNGAEPPDAPKRAAAPTTKLFMASKQGIYGPVSFNIQGIPPRIRPKAIPNLAVRTSEISIKVSAAA
ncbi:hypothetical protein F5Y13DRAFT_155310 [Hypoxylon sp. FL1857]|nr:hypothetical protein F5Y13DRAFT_155310 [Hypoxylon sp. FL1857]